MKKSIFLLAFIGAIFTSYGQGKTFWEVNMVKPKPGMNSTFESKWKTHANTFHKSDNKRMVYEILTGPYMGYYQIVEGPMSYADMDIDKGNDKEHGLDLEKNYFPNIDAKTMHGIYRWDDTASYNPSVVADKFLVTVTHVKFGQMPGTLREAKRTALMQSKLPIPFKGSVNTYVQILSGSDPVMVTVRNLKDGFKELETNYFGAPNPPDALKNAYVKVYGQEAWDARSKLLDDNANVASREVYLMQLRKDLSSK